MGCWSPLLLVVLLLLGLAGGHELLFYNRIPKTGSSTLTITLRELASQNQFHVVSTLRPAYYRRDPPELEAAIASLSHGNVVFVNHVIFYTPPVPAPHRIHFLQLVRHPVARLLSLYYFSLSSSRPRYLGQSNRRRVRSFFGGGGAAHESQRNHTLPSLDECLQRSRQPEECLRWTLDERGPLTNRMVRFFCGYDPVCQRSDSGEALSLAKRHAVHNYTAVGVLEHMSASLRLFERRLPQFFLGARHRYVHANSTPHPNATERVRTYIEQHHANDIRLYEFLVDRLLQQTPGG
jgi:Sulfotransferase family